ncbi:MAG: DUF4199 domain-containing protein [Bacteroidales bacterium]|jgi:hypothetical protein|nr:DUF4199 domain-containing protein [Bacteroidales bacterium]
MNSSGKWSSAAVDGLLLSLVTIIYILIGSLFPKMPGVLRFLVWAIKFTAVIYILRYFMKEYFKHSDTVSYGQSFNYGFIICIFSSIVCAAFAFANSMWLFADQTTAGITAIQQAFSGGNYTEEQEDAISNVLKHMPQYLLFGSFLYYLLIGTIITSIMANYTKKDNIFTDGGTDNNINENKKDDEETQALPKVSNTEQEKKEDNEKQES